MEKEIILGYEVNRKKVKNINLRIRADGSIYISAPINLDKYYIMNFINSKKEFIDYHINRINKIKKLTKNLDVYIDNTFISFLGNKYLLKIIESNNKNIVFNDKEIIIYNDEIDENTIKNIIYSQIYYPKAKKLFSKRLKYYLELMEEVNDIKLKISNLKGKWGYCIPKKREIALSIELLKRSEIELDSVIVHEITHLKHPNHSKNFYIHIDKYLKNYKEINKKLNTIITNSMI